jgi:hypothetical protein
MSWDRSMRFHPLPVESQEDNVSINSNMNAEYVGSDPTILTGTDAKLQATADQSDYDNKRKRQEAHSCQTNDELKLWFGDELTFNDRWKSGEYTDTLRIGAININGISKQLNWLEWDIIVQTMSKLQIDMLGITEPNINFNHKKTLLQLRDIAKKTDRSIQISTSCSNQLNSLEKKWEEPCLFWLDAGLVEK